MRQHLFAIFKPKYSFLSFCFYKKANFNKPFLEKKVAFRIYFNLSKSGDLFEWK